MDNNFFGEIEDFLHNMDSSPLGVGCPGTPNANNTNAKQQQSPLKTAPRVVGGAEKRKLEEDSPPLGSPGFGELSKNAKLEDSSEQKQVEVPRAPNRSTLLAQALTEKRPLNNNPSNNNSILDPVSGALTKEDPHGLYEEEKPRGPKGGEEIRSYIKQNPNVNRLLNQLQSNKPGPKKGKIPPSGDYPSFADAPLDPSSKDSLDFAPFDPSSTQQMMMMRAPNGMYTNGGPQSKVHPRRQMNGGNPCFNPAPLQQSTPQVYPQQHDMNGWGDYSNNPKQAMYAQQQQMRPVMNFNGRSQMNGFPPNEFGMNSRGGGFTNGGGPNYGSSPRGGPGNMIPGGNNMYRRMPYNGSYGNGPQMQQQYIPPDNNYNNNNNGVYNVMDHGSGDFGGGMPLTNSNHGPQRMNYGGGGGMIPQPMGSPRLGSPGTMRYDQQPQSYDFNGGNRFAGNNNNRFPDYSSNNPTFHQSQRPPYRGAPMAPAPRPHQNAYNNNNSSMNCFPGEESLYNNNNEVSEFNMMNLHHHQTTPQQVQHGPHHMQQGPPLTHMSSSSPGSFTQKPSSHHQTEYEIPSWKVNANDMRKGLLENLQKALGQDPNSYSIAEQVELEAFNTSHTKEAYYQRLAEWLAGIFSQQQQQQQQGSTFQDDPSCPQSNGSNHPSPSTQNSIPDSSNQWSEPLGGGDVSSTELLDGVLQLDSSTPTPNSEEESKGLNTSNSAANAGSTSSGPSNNSSSSSAGNDSESNKGNNGSTSSSGGSSSGGGNSSSAGNGSSKSQVHPILSSLLPVSSSSSSSNKSVVDELFSSSLGSPSVESTGGGPASSDSFQSPLSLSSPTSSSPSNTTTNTLSSSSSSSSNRRPGVGSGSTSPPNANTITPTNNNNNSSSSNNTTNILNNPHSVDSGIGSPRSITSSSLYSPKIPQGTSPSLIPTSENSPDK